MPEILGYNKPLFILAFDHRASFAKMIFGKEELSSQETELERGYKHLIYQGAVKAISEGLTKEYCGILVDEYSGDRVLKDAAKAGLITILTTEKSGQKEFMFEYGQDFPAHIERYHPTFTKALVRYNPDGSLGENEHSRQQLKILSDFSHANGYKFLIEPLVLPTKAELWEVSGNRRRFDKEVRPDLIVRMIKELQLAGVEPDIWKIEGLSEPVFYEEVVAQARSGGRGEVSCVILGRGESKEEVEKWIYAGRQVSGLTGFAIGRTIFSQALMDLHKMKINENEAISQIAGNYLHFYRIFKG